MYKKLDNYLILEGFIYSIKQIVLQYLFYLCLSNINVIKPFRKNYSKKRIYFWIKTSVNSQHLMLLNYLSFLIFLTDRENKHLYFKVKIYMKVYNYKPWKKETQTM